MEDNKTQVFLYVICIATLLIAVAGTTFSWYGINTLNNKEVEEKIITKTNMISTIFETGNQITLSRIAPGFNQTYKFSIGQTDSNSNEVVQYQIKLNINTNTITDNITGGFYYTLKSSGNYNGGTIVSKEKTEFPKESITLGEGTIDGFETHEYELTLELPKTTKYINKKLIANLDANIIVELIEE